MRKIKIRTPKSLSLPKNTPVVLLPPSLYYINHIMAQEKAERQAKRQQFWEDVWKGLKITLRGDRCEED